jgi:HK97 family phage portal protein
VIPIGYWRNLFAAIRGRDPKPRANLNPFYFTFTSGTGRPQPRTTINFARLRAFSESPIPRRAIDYIKNQVSMLDWDVVVKGGKRPNGRQKKGIAKVCAILEAPNSHESWRTFIEQIVEDCLVVGYAAVEKRRWETNPDKPLVLYPFDAASLHIYTDWDGSPNKPRFAQVDKYGNTINFTDDQLMYIRYNPRTSTPWGLSPLEVAAQTIDYLLQAQAYAGRMASNATPRKLIDFGEDVDEQQIKEIRLWWRNEVEGRGHTPIIGGSKGAQSIELGATNDEGLFLKWQQFLINQIANAFGLDSQKFGAVLASRATGDILDDASDEGAIRPLAHSIAAAINREIIQALGFKDLEFRFRWTANYKDRKSLAAIHQIYATQDILTIDEIRAELGYPPLPDDKGKYTLAEYRAIYAVSNTNSTVLPAGVVSDEENDGMNPGYNTPKIQTNDEKPMNQTADPMRVET